MEQYKIFEKLDEIQMHVESEEYNRNTSELRSITGSLVYEKGKGISVTVDKESDMLFVESILQDMWKNIEDKYVTVTRELAILTDEPVDSTSKHVWKKYSNITKFFEDNYFWTRKHLELELYSPQTKRKSAFAHEKECLQIMKSLDEDYSLFWKWNQSEENYIHTIAETPNKIVDKYTVDEVGTLDDQKYFYNMRLICDKHLYYATSKIAFASLIFNVEKEIRVVHKVMFGMNTAFWNTEINTWTRVKPMQYINDPIFDRDGNLTGFYLALVQ
jgi:hypothetical protein